MEDRLVTALASSIASALVKAMSGDPWLQIRRQLASALGLGNAELSRTIDTQLEESRWLLENAPEGMRTHTADQITAEWRGTLRALFTEHPSLVEDVQHLFGRFHATSQAGHNNHRLSKP
jgi:hypothetical protein